MNILVVCTGNICRSPMGEVVLAKLLAEAGVDATVRSAGVSNEESGNPIDSRAVQVLRESGYTVPSDHRAHRATTEELREANIVLAMTTGHARSLRDMMQHAGADLSHLHLWREFDGSTPIGEHGVFGEGGVLAPRDYEERGKLTKRKAQQGSNFYFSGGEYDVPDPWYGGIKDFYTTLETLEAGANGLVKWLQRKPT